MAIMVIMEVEDFMEGFMEEVECIMEVEGFMEVVITETINIRES
jgi:hypothetical protein